MEKFRLAEERRVNRAGAGCDDGPATAEAGDHATGVRLPGPDHSTGLRSGQKSRYRLRFDDICPTMNWALWHSVETVLLDLNIKPILAVIPDNQDCTLHKGERNDRFWDCVRKWQDLGWTIGLHGYQHRYITRQGGIVGINRYSEFAGLCRARQDASLRRAVGIFQREGVIPDVWVAPAHSFDEETVGVLHSLGITKISDGYHLYPYRDRQGMMWVPQQLAVFRRIPFGLWTVCVHLDDSPYCDPVYFAHEAARFRSSIVSFNEVISEYSCREKSLPDSMFASCLLRLKRTKAKLSRII